MEKIKKQVTELIAFKATTFEELAAEYDSLSTRIQEGLAEMKASKVFTDVEIREVKDHAFALMDSGYKATRGAIAANLRENFEFQWLSRKGQSHLSTNKIMRTSREFQLALGKLFDRARANNSWSENSFKEASTHVIGVSKSEASRFYKALLDMDQLRYNSEHRVITNFEANIWKNEDVKLGLIRDILEIYPIRQQRGRIKGKVYPKAHTMAEAAIILQEEINPLSAYSAEDLVKELRERGFAVTATRQVITTEEL